MKKKKLGRPSQGLDKERHFCCDKATIETLKGLKQITGKSESELIRAAIAGYRPVTTRPM